MLPSSVCSQELLDLTLGRLLRRSGPRGLPPDDERGLQGFVRPDGDLSLVSPRAVGEPSIRTNTRQSDSTL